MKNPILAHQTVSLEGSVPSRWMLVLPGIFGMGSNFRSFAKALASRVPNWGFVLVDLRGHGQSQGFAPPHTLAAAAEDIAALVEALDVPVHGISGHSFGGKVTLAYLAMRHRPLANAFVLDSVPGARPERSVTEETTDILALLESVPKRLDSRDQFVDLLARAGISKRTSDWLAMNVRRDGDVYGLRLDLPAIRALLDDYYQRDFWSVVADPTSAQRLDLVIGGASSHWSAENLARARALVVDHPHVHVSVLKTAGHWLHVDDPEGLLDVMATALRY